MPKKALLVEVELNVEAVTCPGVWLCPNGKISLQLYMLGSTIQTHSVDPVFPIAFHEKFIFAKTYFDVGKLGALQKIFNKDTLYVEMIQWLNCENGNVLATFQTSLAELLYPESKKHTLGSAEVDLLMEPMKNFPGILAPKIEVTTKTTIQDKVCHDNELGSQVMNPNMITSTNFCQHQHQQRYIDGQVTTRHQKQKPVCHTKMCHNKMKKCSSSYPSIIHLQDKRPPFVVRKVDDVNYTCHCKDCIIKDDQRSQLIVAKPSKSSKQNNCTVRRVNNVEERTSSVCCTNAPAMNKKSSSIVQCAQKQPCECGDDHSDNCIVCAKYKHYFESKSIKSRKRQQQPEEKMENMPENMEPCICGQEVLEARMSSDDMLQSTSLCNYPPQPSASRGPSTMAQKLHSRLADTLSRCVDCQQSLINNNCTCCMMDNCDCGYLQDCATTSFGQMYKKIYNCKSKCY